MEHDPQIQALHSLSESEKSKRLVRLLKEARGKDFKKWVSLFALLPIIGIFSYIGFFRKEMNDAYIALVYFLILLWRILSLEHRVDAIIDLLVDNQDEEVK